MAQLIMLKGSISVKELAEEFNISAETIRKDLILLKKDNSINKNYCAAISPNYLESHFDDKLLKNISEKFKIAQKAVEMIHQNGVVILDSGTTVLQIAKLLNLKSDLVIVTSSLILENTKNQLIVIGGELQKKSMSFVGNLATKAIENIHADIAFVGYDGFHKDGPSSRSYGELEVKQRIFKNSKEVVLVTDSSKFSRNGLYRFATFDQFNYLITDTNIKEEELELLSTNIEVIIV
ncbi:DeoR/GlpR family DNA-binding transcription regulator [Clostridium puniceum]|nr:DeoR/GlpR family DNA-binding transcription regulator [Clostridium puniceum]